MERGEREGGEGKVGGWCGWWVVRVVGWQIAALASLGTDKDIRFYLTNLYKLKDPLVIRTTYIRDLKNLS